MPTSASKTVPVHNPLATLEELAAFLRLEANTVKRPGWRAKMGIRDYRFGRRCIRFDLEEIRNTIRKEVVSK